MVYGQEDVGNKLLADPVGKIAFRNEVAQSRKGYQKIRPEVGGKGMNKLILFFAAIIFCIIAVAMEDDKIYFMFYLALSWTGIVGVMIMDKIENIK